MNYPMQENLSAMRKSKFFPYVTLALGLFVGSLISKWYSHEAVMSRLTRDAAYFQEYKNSDFYKNNPAAKGSNPLDVHTTYDRLLSAFPYVQPEEGEDVIPKTIFQMWRMTPDEAPDFPNIEEITTWQAQNPEFNYTFIRNREVDALVQKVFEHTIPEIWEGYRIMPKMILQSDLGRYILLFLYGGVYADIDTVCEKPIREWYDEKVEETIAFSVGMEHDNDGWRATSALRVQLANWTIKARQHHPMLAFLIANVLKTTFTAKTHNKLTAYYQDFKDVDKCSSVDIIQWTGPGMMSMSLYEYASTKLDEINIVDMSYLRQGPKFVGPENHFLIDWNFFTGLQRPAIINDLMVYPRKSFRGENPCGELCFVTHHPAGSWKSGNV